MNNKEYLENSSKYIINTYKRFPRVMVKGKGFKVWDSEGREYYDFVSGLAVNNLGHCHPRVVEAIRNQAGELIHISNLYHIAPQIKLARRLSELSFAAKSFFCNSGAEANEAAIKLARRYAKEHSSRERYEIITFRDSFHGRTMAALSATGQEKLHRGFEPLLPGFKYVPYNNLALLKEAITENTCAVMLEPIQGEGGVNIPDRDYLLNLRQICKQRNIILILDEVQTGIGRTGKMFAYEHFGITPDIMTLAKSLGGGVALGAMLSTEKIAASFVPGTHASTFGGNPLACSAGLAAIEAIIAENMLTNCKNRGDYFIQRLKQLAEKFNFIKEVRGKGLLIALELDFPGEEVTSACLEKGFLINCIRGKILRFLPPLTIGKKEIDLLIEALEEIFKRQ